MIINLESERISSELLNGYHRNMQPLRGNERDITCRRHVTQRQAQLTPIQAVRRSVVEIQAKHSVGHAASHTTLRVEDTLHKSPHSSPALSNASMETVLPIQ